MIHTSCTVHVLEVVGPNIYVLSLLSPEIATTVNAGQFVNIKVNDVYQPLLRRPFSVYRVDGDYIEIIFNVIGIGTKILSTKRKGDILDIFGPLGHSFKSEDDFETALLVAGGLGVAPLPMMTSALRRTRKKIVTFLGARTRDQLIVTHLDNINRATDDGSAEFHGTVVDLLAQHLNTRRYPKPKIFACGPNPMLYRLSQLAEKYDIPCEMSLESAMACGVGLCQGCPVETRNGEKKYALICTAGPVFDSRTIRIA